MLLDCVDDIRYGLRQFVRTPGLTAVAILTLAIGIGATTAIFSLLDAATLQRLPVQHPEQLRTVLSFLRRAPRCRTSRRCSSTSYARRRLPSLVYSRSGGRR